MGATLLFRVLLVSLLVIHTPLATAADNDVAIASRATVVGDLVPGEEDRLAFVAVAGALLDVRLDSHGGLISTLTVRGPEGDQPLGASLGGQGTDRQRIRRFELPFSGTWKLAIGAAQGAGTYRVRVQVRLPRGYRKTLTIGADGSAAFDLGAGVGDSQFDLRLRSLAREGIAPSLLSWTSSNLDRPELQSIRSNSRSFKTRFATASRDVGPLAWVVRGEPLSAVDVRLRVREPRGARTSLSLIGDPAGTAARIPREHPNSGMQEFLRPDRIASLRPGERTAGFSSFDRQGGNDDGWSGIGNWLSFRSDPTSPTGVELTLLELQGAGILHRMHFAFRSSIPEPLGDPTAEDYSIRFYLDGATTPSFEFPVRTFVDGSLSSFPFPVASDDLRSSGGPYNNVPVPFTTGLRITTTDFPHYYDFQHVIFAEPPTGHRSYGLQDDPEPVRLLLDAAGADPRPEPDLGQVVVTTHVPRDGESFPLFERTGEGFVERIDFQVDPPLEGALEELWFEVRYDGEVAPRVRVPLGYLFGNGVSFTNIDALMFRMDAGGGGSIHWPIPYGRSIRIDLKREGGAANIERVACRVVHREQPYGETFGHFHGEFRRELTRFDEDFVLLDRTGRGHVVAVDCVIRSDSSFARAWMEGDERIFLDGSNSPAVHGTGTEEFFGWGWYDTPMDRLFDLPQHGYPLRRTEGPIETTAMYRLLFPDAIRFEQAIRFSFEHGPENNWNADYAMAVFYYAQDAPGLIQTDAFDPANGAERAAHGHVSPLAVPVSLTSVYEGRSNPTALSDDGLELTSAGEFEFTVSVDSANAGVVLRRRTDQFEYLGQTADVYVDGAFVGTWRTAKNNFTQRWLDDEFALPERVTSSRSALTVRIVPTRFPWNVYHWEIFSRLNR